MEQEEDNSMYDTLKLLKYEEAFSRADQEAAEGNIKKIIIQPIITEDRLIKKTFKCC